MRRLVVPLLGLLGGGAVAVAFFAAALNHFPRAFWTTKPGQAITNVILRATSEDPKSLAVLKPGQPMPLVTVTALDGSQTTLRAPTGRKLLVNFWATWCGPCLVELPALKAAAEGPLHQSVDIVGIAGDDTLPPVTAYLASHPLSYPVYWSALGPAGAEAKFGGPALPYSVLIDETGRVKKAWLMGFAPGEIEKWAR